MDEHLARESAPRSGDPAAPDRPCALVAGLRAGHPEAWRALHDTFAERVWGLVARLVGPNSADVADVVQEVMLAAARSARTYDPACGPLWNWLCGIVRVQVALHFRNQKRHDRFRTADEWLAASAGRLARWLDGAGDAPTDALETAETALAVRLALAELTDEYGALLTAKYLDGASVEQLAARDQVTETAVRSKLARAREAFRKVFLRLAGDDPGARTEGHCCAGDGGTP
ncbi:MAG TPA: sigma-70 family RNA polymerase sigma factor [Gemmata sp.]